MLSHIHAIHTLILADSLIHFFVHFCVLQWGKRTLHYPFQIQTGPVIRPFVCMRNPIPAPFSPMSPNLNWPLHMHDVMCQCPVLNALEWAIQWRALCRSGLGHFLPFPHWIPDCARFPWWPSISPTLAQINSEFSFSSKSDWTLLVIILLAF
jgi:hypothetical protein